jgi:hypothetical protein
MRLPSPKDPPTSTVRERGRNGTLPRVKLGRHVRYIRRHGEATILDADSGDRQPRPHPGPAPHTPKGQPTPLSTKTPWREGVSVVAGDRYALTGDPAVPIEWAVEWP